MAFTRLIKSIGGRKTAPTKTGAAANNVGNCAVLDHPQQGERISSPCYTFRVGAAPDAERVELSINKGPWQPCRCAVGYWWYDWAGYTAGKYQAEVKAWTKSGKAVAAGPVKFQVSYGECGKKTK